MVEQKKIKRATYQIIVEIRTGDTLIDATDDEKVVDGYLSAWDANIGVTAMKIYMQNENGAYNLAIFKSRAMERKIGFCR